MVTSLQVMCWTTGVCLALSACAKSPLQPSISDRDPTAAAPSVVAAIGAPVPSKVSCTRAKGHNVYYAGSAIRLSYVCSSPVASVLTTLMPAYLAATGSGTGLVFAGTAPAAASKATWGFSVNGLTTTGDNVVTTQVITSTPAAALKAPGVDIASAYGALTDLGLAAVTLDPAWDGSTDDVTLSILPQTPLGSDLPATFNGQAVGAADADLPALVYVADCTTGTGPFLCPSPTAAAGKTSVTGGGALHFSYGAFDEGSYRLAVRPLLTVEGAVMRLPALKVSAAVPRTAGGNAPITPHTGSTSAAATIDRTDNTYGLDVGSASAPLTPVLGGSYVSGPDAANVKAYFARLAMDRTTPPTTAGGLAIAAAQPLLSGASTSRFARVRALADGSWAAFSVENDGAGNVNAFLSHLSAGPTLPAVLLHTPLTNIGNGNTIAGFDVSAPYTDLAGKSRLAFANIWNLGGTLYLDVGKVNAAAAAGGFGAGTIEDDPLWQPVNPAGPPYPYMEQQLALGTSADNITIAEATYNGGPTFFLAYRHDAVLEFGLVPEASAGPSPTGTFATIAADAFPAPFSAVPAGNDRQVVRMAVGMNGATQVLGVAYRETGAPPSGAPATSGGPACWFRRVDTASLTSTVAASAPLKLSAAPCEMPRIHFNAASGRFVVVYGEQTGSTWQLVEREIMPGAPDTASAALVVVSGLAAYPAQLETALYPAGDFVGVLYRTSGVDSPRVHGFHVSPY